MRHLALLSFLALPGCYNLSSAVWAAKYRGMTVTDYVKKVGPPDRTMDLPDGTTVATWYSAGADGTHSSTLTYDSNGIITDFNHR